jgi:hypothetical protein
VIYLISNHSSAWKLRKRGDDFGWLISHGGWNKPVRADEQMPYALDNGMYFEFGREPHGQDRICEFFGRCGKAHGYHKPLFAVVPDMPYDWDETKRRWSIWSKPCKQLAPSWTWGIVVQDGATESDLDRLGVPVNKSAVCVGGSSAWKDKTIPMWGRFCERHGLWLHVLRVNGADRINACKDAGANSVDGTGLFRGDLWPEEESVSGTEAADVVSVDDGFGEYGRP